MSRRELARLEAPYSCPYLEQKDLYSCSHVGAPTEQTHTCPKSRRYVVRSRRKMPEREGEKSPLSELVLRGSLMSSDNPGSKNGGWGIPPGKMGGTREGGSVTHRHENLHTREKLFFPLLKQPAP